MCSKKCAKPEWPGSYSSREPVRTIDQKVARPLLGIGSTMTVRPLSSFFVVVGKGMMPFTSWASCASVRAPGINVAQTSSNVETRRAAVGDDVLVTGVGRVTYRAFVQRATNGGQRPSAFAGTAGYADESRRRRPQEMRDACSGWTQRNWLASNSR